MESERVTDQILGLIRNHCKPDVVAELMRGLRRGEALERQMAAATAGESTGSNDPRHKKTLTISLVEPDKLDRLLTLCYAKLSPDALCQVLLGMGDIFKANGETMQAEEMYSMALARGAVATSSKEVLAEAYMRRGEMYSSRGLWKQSSVDLGKSRLLFRELGERKVLARVDNILGTNCAEQGKLKEAVLHFKQALMLSERTQQAQMAGVVEMNLGILSNIMGEYDTALVHYKRAQSSFEAGGEVRRLAELHHNMGMSYLSKERYQDAIREFDVSHLLASKNGHVGLMGLSSLGKAHARYCLHDLPIALQLVNQAIAAFTRCHDRPGIADGYKIKGMIHRQMQSYETAESYLQTSLRINEEINNKLNIAETWFELGLLDLKRGRKDQGVRAMEKARIVFKKVGAQREVKKIDLQIRTLSEMKQ